MAALAAPISVRGAVTSTRSNTLASADAHTHMYVPTHGQTGLTKL